LVSALEDSIVNTLSRYNIQSAPKADAPGVYVDEKKICSLGLRIKKGKSFHGLALNINMDLEPFLRINPCGYTGLEMTQLNEFTATPDMALIKQQWVEEFCQVLAMQPKWETQ
jgi:lipoyl(octanoyl) transferase